MPGLISGLHHTDVHAGFLQLREAVFRILKNFFSFFLNLHSLPGARDHLFARISPEVRIMEVNQQLLSGSGGAPPNLYGGRDVAVTPSEAAALVIIWVIPDPDADGVDAAVCEQTEEICLFPIKVKVFHAAGLLRQHAGHVHAEKKAFREIVNLSDIQRGDFLRGTGSREQQAQNQQQSQQDRTNHYGKSSLHQSVRASRASATAGAA